MENDKHAICGWNGEMIWMLNMVENGGGMACKLGMDENMRDAYLVKLKWGCLQTCHWWNRDAH